MHSLEKTWEASVEVILSGNALIPNKCWTMCKTKWNLGVPGYINFMKYLSISLSGACNMHKLDVSRKERAIYVSL